ncbi:MAG: glycosyltransferase [Euryarchaeota archaeon]|jgi:glycosyltransferase involved in cell wall biosynthesis|nr:glycosyltransferase [Euryarchaeota archaeon]MBT7244748.1 glycosyltransferase [Euryarchaeota archaeon]
MLARGGAMSPYSGLGSTHSALLERLKSGSVEGYQLGSVHEYDLSKNPIKRLWRRWKSAPKKVAQWAEAHDIVHITDQEQAGLVPQNGKSIVTVHDLFHLFPSQREGVEIGDHKPSMIRKRDLNKIKQGIARADLLVCVSKDTKQECEMRFPGIATAWIPHAIEIEQYAVDTVRPSWFKDGINLIIIGSEEPRKRVEFAIEVCGGINVTLHKIGAESSPDSKKKLCNLADDLDCNLNWVGRLEQDEMIAALQHADALLFPSIAEGFGLPPLEAYAAGTVALVADAPAHNEIPLEHHILPHDDIQMWRTAILELSDESDEVRARAADFSVEKWTERLQEAYNSLF